MKSVFIEILDARINRETARLENGALGLGPFLELVVHKMCYDPQRHCAQGQAPDLASLTLTARRRGALPPIKSSTD